MLRRTTKKEPTVSPELKELKAIRRELKHIRSDLDRKLHQSRWQRISRSLTAGTARGVGFVFGTTVVAAMIAYLIESIIGWRNVSDSIELWIGQIVQQI